MAAVKRPLYISVGGAVTPAGLNARQTISAIRANLSAFQEVPLSEPFPTTQIVARIPAKAGLRRNDGVWLASMGARALKEAMLDNKATPDHTAVLLALPESFRDHPAYEEVERGRLLNAILERCGLRFNAGSRVFDGGAAASAGLLDYAGDMLESGTVAQVLLGGVDSLVNGTDIARLMRANRLKSENNAQGAVPGEGAVFVRLTRAPGSGPAAMICGAGLAQEIDSVLSERQSQGRAMVASLLAAFSGSGPKEPDIEFVVSNGNGERYSGLEQLVGRSRFYRTHREIFPTAYPAMTVGDIGAASAALVLMLAADSFISGYAPGRVAACELASEGGNRSAIALTDLRQR
ncbi:hypothetical protein [Mesorhizobium sp. M0676]|uniref:hypothetical protein n=1 Tax=Mesorhizobium sp. M0676 TaxID=2956984 RepID=UPI00333C4363